MSCPKSRGLRCKSARNCSAASAEKARLVGMDGGGALAQGGEPLPIESVDGVADRLLVATAGPGQSGAPGSPRALAARI